MSDEILNEVEAPSELETLKARADQMGIKYRYNVKVERLRELIDEKLNGKSEEAAAVEPKAETAGQMRARLKKECMKLVRIRATCQNPDKKNWPGEIFTCSNSFVSAKKYVPFDAEDGYHVPWIIYQMMKDRKCQVFTKKKAENGVPIMQGKLIPEFVIEVLPDLTEAELKDLAQRQAMAGSVS